jgi:hypothetical protein
VGSLTSQKSQSFQLLLVSAVSLTPRKFIVYRISIRLRSIIETALTRWGLGGFDKKKTEGRKSRASVPLSKKYKKKLQIYTEPYNNVK